ncbi:molybdate ABC transporter substrate-binding protein [Desulforhopalus singaporensis]|uniref:Molybdate transport system substrate-binding protein n=1 Tax=Desulforhopalus singaporensis TaxID=91360 RepID=A0A1H0KMC8_9BACT|nr:molybdate ABC transporter substrate-binding protein [Desulforhopalus singaporensis]SDO57025.1 molybdate transport system substrate-binding protein [Desulforhopalus singaporensis]
MKKIKILLCILALSLWCHGFAYGESLYVSVAASMTDAFKEIISAYPGDDPDDRILPNFASSGSLAKQIAQGAPADLYVSANPKWMRFLADNHMIDEATRRIFAFNKLVFVGRSGGGVSQLAQLTSLEKIAIGTPQSVPAGQYAKQAMEGAGIYQPLKRDRKLVMAKDVRQALLYADRGEVDGAFVYRTDALLAQNAAVLFTVPDELYDRVSYPLALTVSGSKKALAVSFYEFIGSPQVSQILSKYGFEPAR